MGPIDVPARRAAWSSFVDVVLWERCDVCEVMHGRAFFRADGLSSEFEVV